MKKSGWITIGIIVLVIAISIFILVKPTPETSEEIAKCIGEHSVLYVQLGCHACERQEELFGDNYQFLTVVDCVFERDKCDSVITLGDSGFFRKILCKINKNWCGSGSQQGISVTPTWIIDQKKYEGVQTLEKLKELTGC